MMQLIFDTSFNGLLDNSLTTFTKYMKLGGRVSEVVAAK